MTSHDTVAFRVGPESTIEIEVNGRRLADLIGDVERAFAEREGSPDIAGAYAGIPSNRLDAPVEQHFLGGPGSDMVCGPANKTVLLACQCGEPGCWPLMAVVDAGRDVVSWREFEQPHRRERWSYDAMRQLTFERSQYEQALAALRRELG